MSMFAHAGAKGGHWASSSATLQLIFEPESLPELEAVLSVDRTESSGIACLHTPVLLEATGG